MINKIKQKIIGFKQKRKVRELEKILCNEMGIFWKSNPTKEQVKVYYGKIHQFYEKSLDNLTRRLKEFKQNPSKKLALSFERTYDNGMLYEVGPLERVCPSFNRQSNYEANGLIGFVEIAEELLKVDDKQAKKLIQRVYDWGLYKFHTSLSVEESLKYWYCNSEEFGLALPHVNNSSYTIGLLYSIARSAKLFGESDEFKNALLRVPEISKFLGTKEGRELKQCLEI